MCEYCNTGDINAAAALDALSRYRRRDASGDILREDALIAFRAIYNDDKAAELAVNRIAGMEPGENLPLTKVVSELELLLTCLGAGRGMLDG